MPAAAPISGLKLKKLLAKLGGQIRARRKELGVSASVAAESAAMSRQTLHRIEKGETSVTMGAYLGLLSALGLEFELINIDVKSNKKRRKVELPKRVRLAKYPQLKRLAWQIKDSKEISLKEALNLYERNWKHISLEEMSSEEGEFVKDLLAYFGREKLLV
ncbi:MAG: helix-turn-helix domain-containing protein [Bdellovibrionales bacterium]|nr:helix-turn-helix domain-containing protein [Bdellovibrionales bacterium]